MTHRSLTLVLAGSALGLIGSAGCAKNRGCCPPGGGPPPPVVAGPAAPYGAVPPPSGSVQGPAYYQGRTGVPSEPIVAPPIERYNANGNWRPAPAPESRANRVPTPQVEEEGNKARLLPPNSQGPETRPLPPAREKEPDLNGFPADIQNYHVVGDQVASGLQPPPEGFGWLREHGYRAVLHLRPQAEGAAAIKAEVEGKGLAYRSLEVTPSTLTRDLVDQFAAEIRNSQNLPLFVFDKNGTMAGALWYLHFRLNEKAPDSVARQRAIRLGLPDDTKGDHAEWWLAINRLLPAAESP